MKKVLVLGGSYFIGLSVVNTLLDSGYDVYTLNRGTRKKAREEVHELKADRNNFDEVKKAISDIEFSCVVDVSGLNVNQAEILTGALDKAKLEKLIFVSSSSVYDIDNLKAPLLESDKLSRNKYWGDYGENKIEAEKYYSNWSKKSGIAVSIVRPPYVYGENNYARRESFIFNHIENNMPVIVPVKNSKLQFISANDLAKNILCLLEHNESGVSVYNVGNKEALTMKEWVQLCASAAGKEVEILEYSGEEYKDKEYFPFDAYDNILDVSKIKEICPKEENMLEELKKAYAWYSQNKSEIEFKKEMADVEKNIISLQKL